MRINKKVLKTSAVLMGLTLVSPTAVLAQDKTDSLDSNRPSVVSPVKPTETIKDENARPNKPSRPQETKPLPSKPTGEENEAVKAFIENANKEHRLELAELQNAYKAQMQIIRENMKAQTNKEMQAFQDARAKLREAKANNKDSAKAAKELREARKELREARKKAQMENRLSIANLNKEMRQEMARLKEAHRLLIQSIMEQNKPLMPEPGDKPSDMNKPKPEASERPKPPTPTIDSEKKEQNR